MSLAAFKVPEIDNEPMVSLPLHSLVLLRDSADTSQRSYAPGSSDRKSLQEAVKKMEAAGPFEIPAVINGKPVSLSQGSRKGKS